MNDELPATFLAATLRTRDREIARLRARIQFLEEEAPPSRELHALPSDPEFVRLLAFVTLLGYPAEGARGFRLQPSPFERMSDGSPSVWALDVGPYSKRVPRKNLIGAWLLSEPSAKEAL